MSGSEHGHHHAHHAGDEAPATGQHAGHSVAMFRDKFWISLALTIPTLIWGHMLPRLLDYTPPPAPAMHCSWSRSSPPQT